MTIKNWFQLIILLALTTVYVVCFTDWFKPKIIRIGETSRPSVVYNRRSRANATQAAAIPPNFLLGSTYKLTEVKVVLLSAWQTNHDAVPVWHLVSSSNSIPMDKFLYGLNIHGMQPALAGTHAQPLEPDVMYHIIVKAGRAKGEHDFMTKPAN
jgi:hypothetical protein